MALAVKNSLHTKDSKQARETDYYSYIPDKT
jgi:hypothetical protein